MYCKVIKENICIDNMLACYHCVCVCDNHATGQVISRRQAQECQLPCRRRVISLPLSLSVVLEVAHLSLLQFSVGWGLFLLSVRRVYRLCQLYVTHTSTMGAIRPNKTIIKIVLFLLFLVTFSFGAPLSAFGSFGYVFHWKKIKTRF